MNMATLWLGVSVLVVAGSVQAAPPKVLALYPVTAKVSVNKKEIAEANVALIKVASAEATTTVLMPPVLAKKAFKPKPMQAAAVCKADLSCWADLGKKAEAQEVAFGRLNQNEAGAFVLTVAVVSVSEGGIARRVEVEKSGSWLASISSKQREIFSGAEADPLVDIGQDAAPANTEAPTSPSASPPVDSSTQEETAGMSETSPTTADHADSAVVQTATVVQSPSDSAIPAVQADPAALAPPQKSRLWLGVGASLTGAAALVGGGGGYLWWDAGKRYDRAKEATTQTQAERRTRGGDQRIEQANMAFVGAGALASVGLTALIVYWLED